MCRPVSRRGRTDNRKQLLEYGNQPQSYMVVERIHRDRLTVGRKPELAFSFHEIGIGGPKLNLMIVSLVICFLKIVLQLQQKCSSDIKLNVAIQISSH